MAQGLLLGDPDRREIEGCIQTLRFWTVPREMNEENKTLAPGGAHLRIQPARAHHGQISPEEGPMDLYTREEKPDVLYITWRCDKR